MAILEGDIKLLASKVMDDVPEGGGGPSGTVIADGVSNAIFADVTELDRAGGAVSIRQLHAAVRTANTDAFMGANIILAEPPNDPNVAVTLAPCAPFARRTEIAQAVENYLISGPVWAGYLLENHVAGQRSIQLFQRPGSPAPAIGRTLVLVQNEGLPSQVMQYVRVTRVATEQRTFFDAASGQDYRADVLTCDISDPLRTAFAGSPPSRAFARASGATLVRDTTVADATTFYGASALTQAAQIGDVSLRCASVYTQVVPNSRTETAVLDRLPAAQRVVRLASAPRVVETGVTPHTLRIKVGQENRGLVWTQMLKPLPAPGTIVVSYRALGQWYTLYDDGLGAFSGSGSGTVIYTTGSVAVTLPAMPDAGSSVIFAWGETVGFTNRVLEGATAKPPEYCFKLADDGVVPGSITFTWMSGVTLRTATDAGGTGKITGDATGIIDYPSGTVLIKPAFMPNAGATIHVDYTIDPQVMEIITPPAPDAAGIIGLTLAQQPAAGSLSITWVTARNTSQTDGSSITTTNAVKNATATYAMRTVPEAYNPAANTNAPPISYPNWRA